MFQEVDGFYGGHSSIKSFVAGFGSGPFNGLFNGIGCENAENHREVGREAHSGDAFADFVADIIEVRCGTADDGAQTDDGVIPFAGGCGLGNEWDLKGAGGPDQVDIVIADAMALQGVNGSADELVGNEFIEAAGNNCEAQGVGDKGALNGIHDGVPRFIGLVLDHMSQFVSLGA